MHTTHLVCVDADDALQARERAEYLLETGLAGHDYFTVEQVDVDGGEPVDALRIGDDRARAATLLETVAAWQQSNMAGAFDRVDLAVLAGAPALPLQRAATDPDVAYLGHRMSRVGELLAGYWCTDSHYWDDEFATANPWRRIAMVRDGDASDDLWLVQADVHS